MARLRPATPGDAPAGSASNLTQRVIVGLLLAALAAGAIWLGGWLFALLLLVAGLLVIIEFTQMTAPDSWNASRILVLLAFALAWALAAWGQVVAAILLVDAVALAMIAWAATVRHRPMFWCALALLYASAAVIALVWLRGGENGRAIVAWLVLVVAVTDTAAFFAGRTIGGPKLAPSISPNKTWSGLIGGMAGAALAGGLFAAGANLAGWPQIALLSAAVAVVAQLGDLLESQIKRSFGVKDSGAVLPGHGGIMDRLDGYLLAAPVVALAMMPLGMGG